MNNISLLANTVLPLQVFADASISVMGTKDSEGGRRSGVGCGLVVKEVATFVVLINEEVRSDFGLGVMVRKNVCNTL